MPLPDEDDYAELRELLPSFYSTDLLKKWRTWLTMMPLARKCSSGQLDELRRTFDFDITESMADCVQQLHGFTADLLDNLGKDTPEPSQWNKLVGLIEDIRRLTPLEGFTFDSGSWNRVLVDRVPVPEYEHFARLPFMGLRAHEFRMLACHAMAEGDRGQIAMLLAWHDKKYRGSQPLVPQHVLDDLYEALTLSIRKQLRRNER